MNNQIEVATRTGGHFYFSGKDRIKHTLSPHKTPHCQKQKKAIEKSTALVGLPGFELQQRGSHCKVEPIPTSAGHNAEQ